MLTMAVPRSSSDDTQIGYVYTFGFMDDIMFSHNGQCESESETTLFHPVRQVAALGVKML